MAQPHARRATGASGQTVQLTLPLAIAFPAVPRAESLDAPSRRSDETDPTPQVSLPDRLYRLGLPRDIPIRVTHNRVTLLSWRSDSGLRLHAGFAAAPNRVLHAVVRFLSPGVRRAERMQARRTFMAFPVQQFAGSRTARPRRLRTPAPADAPLIARLTAMHAGFNVSRFGGTLRQVSITLSSRMRTGLGIFRAADRAGGTAGIGISRLHLRRDGWQSVGETLLHEMVHQWQAEHGLPLDHGPAFRRKAREIGILPRATADVRRR